MRTLTPMRTLRPARSQALGLSSSLTLTLTLHQGLDSMVYFATPKAAIRFSGFEAASNAMRAPDGSPMFGAATSFLAGLAAGALEALVVTTPQARPHSLG